MGHASEKLVLDLTRGKCKKHGAVSAQRPEYAMTVTRSYLNSAALAPMFGTPFAVVVRIP